MTPLLKEEFIKKFYNLFEGKDTSAQLVLLLYIFAKLLYVLYINHILTDVQTLSILENKKNDRQG